MVKKIIILLGLCLLVEGVTFGGALRSFARLPAAVAQPVTAAPALSQTLELPESFTLEMGDAGHELDERALDALAAKETWQRAQRLTLAGYLFHGLGGVEQSWSRQITLDERALGKLLNDLEAKVNRPAQNAELEITENIAVKFQPQRDGQTLDLQESRLAVIKALKAGETLARLPVVNKTPTTKLADLNNFGLKELIARGQTDFSGSSASRLQNIKVGSAQYRGLIIPKGAEFSFNDNLGPIDAAHGYRPELVIKPEGTVPEFGGGLCQVSSTAFRAAFFGGLPITQRRNHSYAVRYYEWISDDRPRSAGLDATIYPGAQDLKFVNDTPGAILIWTTIEGNHLYFDFYGTADGREVAVEGPEVYDRRPSGALKARVTRKVLRENDEVQELVLNSNYVSPNLFPRVFEYPPTAAVSPAAETPPAAVLTPPPTATN